MERCTGRRDINEMKLKMGLNTIQSIKFTKFWGKGQIMFKRMVDEYGTVTLTYLLNVSFMNSINYANVFDTEGIQPLSQIFLHFLSQKYTSFDFVVWLRVNLTSLSGGLTLNPFPNDKF